MLNSNLLELLSKFTPKEIKEFGEFVVSPLFNKNENVSKLYFYIKKYYPDFNNKKLEKEYAYSRIFKGSKYNDGFMRTLMYNLSKLAEGYLTYLNDKTKSGKYNLNLLEELNNRKLEKIFLKNLKEIEQGIEKPDFMDSDYYYELYRIESIKADYTNWSRYKTKDLQDYTKDNILNSIDFFTQYFLIKILNHYAFLAYRKKNERFDFKFELLDKIIHHLKKSDAEYSDNLYIRVVLYEILLQSENDEKYYTLLKDIFINRINELTWNQKYNLHNQIQLYCTNKSYEGEEKYTEDRFELYKIAIKNKLYHGAEDVYFDDVTFGNIVVVGIRLKEYEWVGSFIEKYKGLLAPENRALIVNFCLAKLSFFKGDFENALNILNRMKSIKHLQYKLTVRELMLLTFYELGMYEQAYSFLDSHRHFLVKHRNTFSDIRYDRRQYFLKYYARLLKIKEKPDKNELKELSSEIENIKNISERIWIIDKIKELKLEI